MARVFLFTINLITALTLIIGPAAGGNTEQTGIIAGVVTDSLSVEPVSEVHVFLPAIERGAVTNDRGEFRIPNIPEGMYDLHATHVMYESVIIADIEIRKSEQIHLYITMTEGIIELEEVIVYDDIINRQHEIFSLSVHRVEPENVHTMAGAVEDVFRALSAYPGILSQSDFGSQFIVRGGSPDQNLILVDGVEIFNPYRLYALVSAFNPAMVSDMIFYTGGFPAQYGDRLSSVLDITYRESEKERRFGGTTNLSITDASVIVEGKNPYGLNGNWIISGRRTYYDIILGLLIRAADTEGYKITPPNFTDIQSKFAIYLSDRHRLTFNVLQGFELMRVSPSINRLDDEYFSFRDRNIHNIYSISWRYDISDGLISETIVSFYRNKSTCSFHGVTEESLDDLLASFEYNSNFFSNRTSLHHKLHFSAGRHDIHAGAGINFLSSGIDRTHNLSDNFDIPDQTFLERVDLKFSDYYPQTFAYVQKYFHIGNRVTFSPGVRFDNYSNVNTSYLSPRFGLIYKLGEKSNLQLRTGMYVQSYGYEKALWRPTPLFLPEFDLDRDHSVIPEKALHSVIGVDRRLGDRQYINIEVYHKKYSDIVIPETTARERYVLIPVDGSDLRYIDGWSGPYLIYENQPSRLPVNSGTGESFGIDVLLKRERDLFTFSKLSGWLAYSLSKATMQRYGIWQPFDYDQRHTINIVLEYSPSETSRISVRGMYGSGFPYTPAIGFEPTVKTTEVDGELVHWIDTFSDGRIVPYEFDVDFGDPSNRNTARLPAYKRIDFRYTWNTRMFGLEGIMYIDIVNLLNITNISGYSHSVDFDLNIQKTKTKMLPLIPTIGVRLDF